jgi:LPS export ABC transporter protein LptC
MNKIFQHKNLIIKFLFNKLYFPFILGSIVLFLSCKNDIEAVKQVTFDTDLPSLKVIDMHTTITDSGSVKIIMDAKIMQRFENETETWDEYPEGLHVQFFQDGKVTAQINSEYGIYYADEDLWEVKRNVIAENLVKKETINTERLLWDIKKELIYSDKFVRITTDDEVFFGTGFESNQDFTSWVIHNPVGEVAIKEETENE